MAILGAMTAPGPASASAGGSLLARGLWASVGGTGRPATVFGFRWRISARGGGRVRGRV